MSVAEKQVKELLGLGGSSPHHSPEVPAEILRRQASLLMAGQAGFRIGKYGTEGLKRLYQHLGDALGVPALKDYAPHIGLGTTGLITLLLEFTVARPTARMLIFGSAFYVITDIFDKIEEAVRKAIA